MNDRTNLKSIKANLNDFREKNNQNNIPTYPSSILIKKNDVESILNQYVTKPEEINVILGRCREKGIKMS